MEDSSGQSLLFQSILLLILTLSRRINFLSPSSAFCSTRERFSDTKAISDAEKKAVSKVYISNKIGTYIGKL